MTHRIVKSSTSLQTVPRGYVVVTTVLEKTLSGWLWFQFTIGAGRVWLLGSAYMDESPFLLY